MADFCIATEDRLSEALAEQMVMATGHSVAAKIPRDRRRHAGFGYLKTRLPDFIHAARGGIPFLVVTDLDRSPCPPQLISDWLGETPVPPQFIFRVAVHEAESWVMADRERFATWLGVGGGSIPVAPDAVEMPKEKLLQLASNAKNRDVRDGLLPKRGAPSPVGLEYNDHLCAFVSAHWRIDIAAQSSPSLARAIRRLREFQ